MMRRASLRMKMMVVAMATTLTALVLSAAALLAYELRAFRGAWIDDLSSQADLIALSSAPALAFDDPKVATENLSLLRLRPHVQAAAVYREDGTIFATYTSRDAAVQPFPTATATAGSSFVGDELRLFKPVVHDGEFIGSLYLRARYEVAGRLLDYLLILAVVSFASLALAALVFYRLQYAVTRPILAVAEAAREVMRKRNYGLRVEKTTDDEVGVLVDAFNDMLQEVGRRTEALERSNRDLSIQMSERQRAEDALRAADRRKDEFLATLAHELRNPLAPIANSLEILRRGDGDAALRARARGIMERQVRQMVRLIDDLLELSRITTGKLELRREPIDLLPVLRNALEIVEPAVREKRHRLETRFPEQPVWVHGDATRLAQVFANLLNNAAKYTDPGGRIGVEVDVGPHRVAVCVNDDGIGIEPHMQQAVFEMFMQADKSLERGRAGLGVGLTLARQLVELHGGTIEVFSAGLGQGSRFTVHLPVIAAPQSEPPTKRTPRALPAVALRVLLADDNVDFVASLATMLESLGHHVTVTHDGQSALEAALRAPPDVAFFDIGMPGINGYDLARRLRAHPLTQDIVMVAITGWGQERDRERAREAGFDNHLVKPVDLEQVVDALRVGSAPPV
jgi:signal transduction histidine kinase/CheY-like chemotaxis protein